MYTIKHFYTVYTLNTLVNKRNPYAIITRNCTKIVITLRPSSDAILHMNRMACYLTFRPIALSGYRSIAHEVKPNRLFHLMGY